MSETLTFSPILSPAFERARKLSRVMAVIFTVAFWVTVLLLVAIPVMVAVPSANGGLTLGDAVISFASLSGWPRIAAGAGVAIDAIPVLFLTHHARRLFGHFARGEVFTAETIAHIRAAGLWLVLYTFAGFAGAILVVASGVTHSIHHVIPGSWPLLTGITTFIAAYVMEEARRIAADHAEIV